MHLPWRFGNLSGFVFPEKYTIRIEFLECYILSSSTTYQISGLFAYGSLFRFQIGSFEIVHLENVEKFISEGTNILSHLKVEIQK